jgi:hypothetical protein
MDVPGCVEVAPAAPGMLVRDTKNRDGFVLNVPAEARRTFIQDQPAKACSTRVSPSRSSTGWRQPKHGTQTITQDDAVRH